MASNRTYKLARKSQMLQTELLAELQALVKRIERAETTITELKNELEAVNLKHRERKSTREDIAYLEDLLRCAKKKLSWERLMEGLSKRTPAILATVSAVMNDARNPPGEEVRSQILEALSAVQTSMQRLDDAKVT